MDSCGAPLRESPHIDLPRDGSGDKGGAAFLEEIDGALGFGGEGVEAASCACDMGGNFSLLNQWRKNQQTRLNLF